MSIIFFLLFIFSIQKEVKENVLLSYNEILNLSSIYDYHLYVSNDDFDNTIYFIIETELNIMPFDICYSIRGSNETSSKNISIYHVEKKGQLNAFFFKLEFSNDIKKIIDFNVSNINGGYALLLCSKYEQLNSNIIRIENAKNENKIQIYKNKPLILLFSMANFDYDYTFQITVSSFNTFKKNNILFKSNKNMDEIFVLGGEWHIYRETFIIYDNKSYELYPEIGSNFFGGYKTAFLVFEPLIDDNITFQFKNNSYSAYIRSLFPPTNKIGSYFSKNFCYKKLVLPFNCTDYYQDLFYFTIRNHEDYLNFKYFYANEEDLSLDVSAALDLKKVICKSKDRYEYCLMNRTSSNQKNFYFILEGGIRYLNFHEFRSTFFDESNYTIHEPYSSYEYNLDKKNSNLPMVIGDFEYDKKFYLELEINFPQNNKDTDNNIRNIDIYAKILNQKANSYFEFPLEKKGVSLIRYFSTDVKSYYLYESNNKFNSGVKSLFFFVYHRGKYPNCTIKYGTYEEKPIRYENNLILLNQNKSFNITYELFFLSLNLEGMSFLSNDYLYISFQSKKEAFISSKINYKLDNGKVNYNIDGNYSVCEGELREDGENKSIGCFISYKSAKFINFILNLKKNYEINVKTEKIYKGNFVDYLSLSPDKKYIISNNASDNYNYYIFISFDNNFNIEDITYNLINNLNNFTESYPIKDKKEIKGFFDKRIYIKINNKDKKKFIGFKTGKIINPFKIIKLEFDESNTQFLSSTENFKFNLTKNIPLLFLFNFGSKYKNIYFKFSSNIKLDYFNKITYFNIPKFECFSKIANMHKFVENVNKTLYGENKTVIQKRIYINDNLYGMLINQSMEGQLEIEILYNSTLYNFSLKKEIPYDLKKGINLINTNIYKYSKYNFILKHYNHTNSDDIEIYQTNNSDFISNKTFINNSFQIDHKNDINNSYLYFSFNTRPYLIILSNSSSKVTLRQSSLKESDINKYYNLDDKIIEVKNTNKIVIMGGINITDLYINIYYFKYSFDSKYYDELKTTYYIDDEENVDNVVDFYERRKYNIYQIKCLKYKDKIDTYLESNNLRNTGNKTAVFMFEYYNNNHSLNIDLSASKNSIYNSQTFYRSQNTNYDIFNKVFFIYLYESDFEKDDNSYILFEIKGNSSAFNSTQIYKNDGYENQCELFKEVNFCNNTYNENETSIFCNYTKQNISSTQFMLLLNEGNKINIKNIIPEKKEIPTDDGNKGNKSIKYFCYIGIPIIVVALGVIIVIIIIKCKKKKISLDESAKKFETELIPKNEEIIK